MLVQRTMSAEVNPSLVNWLTSMMSMRLHVILEHNPVTEGQIQHYVIYTGLVRNQAWDNSNGYWYRSHCSQQLGYLQRELGRQTQYLDLLEG